MMSHFCDEGKKYHNPKEGLMSSSVNVGSDAEVCLLVK